MQFINRSTVLYGGSAFLGVLTVLYFGFEYLQNLSPFTISVILFSLFGGLLATGLNQKGNSESLAYILSFGSYITGLSYTIGRFGFNSNQVLVSLVISTGLFAGLGYLITEKELEIDRLQLRNILLLLLLGVGLIFSYDIVSGDVTYTAEFDDEITLQENTPYGTLTAEKSSWLPRVTDKPRHNLCFYSEDGEIENSRPGSYLSSEMLGFGPVEKEYELEASLIFGDRIEGFEEGDTVEVVPTDVEECPENSDHRVLVLTS